jgi:ABC-type amino acid transport substrate-binding protein
VIDSRAVPSTAHGFGQCLYRRSPRKKSRSTSPSATTGTRRVFARKGAGKDYAFFGRSHFDPAIHGEGAGIALLQEEDDLREMFNQAIEDMRANGAYKAINDKYFSFDIYGE